MSLERGGSVVGWPAPVPRATSRIGPRVRALSWDGAGVRRPLRPTALAFPPPSPLPQVNEARDAFDAYDSADGELAFEDLGKVLDELGFDEVGAGGALCWGGLHSCESRDGRIPVPCGAPRGVAVQRSLHSLGAIMA